ncbi:MAG: HD domain-containing protein [Candidatus Hydrogenedentales bacterium]|jgi:exopolyphosphatase/guanosine-5'-triphosphate,3'-diphosphate pyrophosphatase
MLPANRFTDAGLLAAAEYAQTHDENPEHSAQVARLSLLLFDATSELHGLGPDEQRLLVAAALLHDVGWPIRPEAHHKGSRDLILKAPLTGFSEEERRMLACLARYHRKAYPNARHKVYRDLSQSAREKVRMLAALLRIADGLDRAHAATVKTLEVRRDGQTLTIEVKQAPGCGIDLMGAERKKGLFEAVFGVDVVIRS